MVQAQPQPLSHCSMAEPPLLMPKHMHRRLGWRSGSAWSQFLADLQRWCATAKNAAAATCFQSDCKYSVSLNPPSPRKTVDIHMLAVQPHHDCPLIATALSIASDHVHGPRSGMAARHSWHVCHCSTKQHGMPGVAGTRALD